MCGENAAPGTQSAVKRGRWASRRIGIAALCAALGFLLIPALLALVLIWPSIRTGWQERSARRFGASMGIASVALASASVGIVVLILVVSNLAAHIDFSIDAAHLAGAINRYHERYDTVPRTLDELATTGLYPGGRYSAGAARTYLPVGRWDGHTRVVVAVLLCKRPFWSESSDAYVVLGDWNVHYVSARELEHILAEDDMSREAIGEPRRWSHACWRLGNN